ncbi:DUF4244 domain-containing protein [Bifidobacterium callitrichos]|uniref:DUF4244 domain-containing protein n=2 Tax=Bifidobacterium callitrichos TaxID=762209 RepID=A0A2T3GA36_9BIFI|nr:MULTISPECIES: DUF4244 domain-containing protein [Bifidobacterium]PST46360.1 DUF4244 domain-containing protein [Bifidobacterium callitrichos]TPF90810.1 hypothetical protein BW11_01955 [Bifidobacterium sp. UTCIF-38]
MMNTKINNMLTSAKARLYMLDARIRTLTAEPEEGAATVEYAAVTVAAVSLGGILWTILKSKEFKALVQKIFTTIFNAITTGAFSA